jgi:hypothetical protein
MDAKWHELVSVVGKIRKHELPGEEREEDQRR